MKLKKLKLINGVRMFRAISLKLEKHLLRLSYKNCRIAIVDLIWE